MKRGKVNPYIVQMYCHRCLSMIPLQISTIKAKLGIKLNMELETLFLADVDLIKYHLTGYH